LSDGLRRPTALALTGWRCELAGGPRPAFAWLYGADWEATRPQQFHEIARPESQFLCAKPKRYELPGADECIECPLADPEHLLGGLLA
jgi:hypothetical protein